MLSVDLFGQLPEELSPKPPPDRTNQKSTTYNLSNVTNMDISENTPDNHTSPAKFSENNHQNASLNTADESSDEEADTEYEEGDEESTEEEDEDTNEEDYESFEQESASSDEEAEQLIQVFTSNQAYDPEVDYAFGEITENMHLSPRGAQSSRGGRARRGNRGGR
ncbi:hypothetical protein K7X08_025115 [Anisodus acutangulus]|uniref:Uncharacterized protein n=1 Tax=Anisodus acutangulus TaxID=402998 RepID=A0A9Q1RFY8_9SOLA|nr:hypothetical protein K7X08_025115 [Anisodus acutangulus]